MAPKKTADVLAEASAKSGLEGLRVLVRRQDDARVAPRRAPGARGELLVALGCARRRDRRRRRRRRRRGRRRRARRGVPRGRGPALAALDDSTGEAPELLGVACALHERLFALRDEAAQHAVAKLCEAWYLANRPGAELLLTQLVPFLLIRSLESDAPESVVKRVHAMRSALLLLDFEDESSGSLQALLLRCFISTLYLRSAEGKRMLLFLFGSTRRCRRHRRHRQAQLAHAPPAVRRAYGELYLRAWRDAAAAGADEPFGRGEPAERRARVGEAGAGARARAAANPSVRGRARLPRAAARGQARPASTRAAALLRPAALARGVRAARGRARALRGAARGRVPLRDPDDGSHQNASSCSTSSSRSSRASSPTTPAVRAAAADGMPRAPRVLGGRARRARARAAARLCAPATTRPRPPRATLGGLALLVEQPLAHGALRVALPPLGPLVDDGSCRVRLAMVELLLAVKAVRSIKFYQIAPPALARLAADSAPPTPSTRPARARPGGRRARRGGGASGGAARRRARGRRRGRARSGGASPAAVARRSPRCCSTRTSRTASRRRARSGSRTLALARANSRRAAFTRSSPTTSAARPRGCS